MIVYPMMYDIMYALVAWNGRDKVLFGDCAPLAHAAFERSCVGNAFPEIWFELPLLGEPWFDLHVLTSREALEPGTVFEPGNTGGHPDLFEWFAGAEGVRQLALSYDVSKGDIDNPAVQLLVTDTRRHGEFLALAGGDEAAASYRALEQRLPQGWFACYTGLFPRRPGSIMHVECIPAPVLQQAYAADASLLESHLRQVGLDNLGDTVVPRCQLLARTPFMLEFQLEVLPGGKLGGTFGASVRFTAPISADEADADASGTANAAAADADVAGAARATDAACATDAASATDAADAADVSGTSSTAGISDTAFDPNGSAGELMERVEAWGLADDRWRLLPDTGFSKRVERYGDTLVAASWPAFLKLRWRDGEPLDAKAYLIATVE